MKEVQTLGIIQEAGIFFGIGYSILFKLIIFKRMKNHCTRKNIQSQVFNLSLFKSF